MTREHDELEQYWNKAWGEEDNTHNPLEGNTKIFISNSRGRGRKRGLPTEIVFIAKGDGKYIMLPREGQVKNGLDDVAANYYPEEILLAGEDQVRKLKDDIDKIRKTRRNGKA